MKKSLSNAYRWVVAAILFLPAMLMLIVTTALLGKNDEDGYSSEE